MSREREIGTLIVVVLKARNLNDKHKFRKQDALAKASLNGKGQQTKVEIKGGQHPVWDEEFRWPIYQSTAKKHRTLEIECYAKEPREDDLLGKGSVDISETLRTGEFDDWVPLSLDGVTRGDVYLEMTYYANGPAPAAVTPPPASPAPALAPSTPANLQRPTGGLAVPQSNYGTGANLMRRPSKLSPSERLARPSGSPPAGFYPSAGPYPSTPLSPVLDERQRRPASVQPSPNPVPNLLRPGAVPSAIRPVSDPIASANPYLTGAASTTRPGTTQPGYQPPAAATPAPPPPSTNPYLGGGATSVPSSLPSMQYASVPTPAPQQYPPQQQHQPPQSQTPVQSPPGAVPALWATAPVADPPTGGFAFPMPSVTAPQLSRNSPPDVTPPIPGAYPITSNVSRSRAASPYGHHRRESDPRDDPVLRARYQTPLPLPPGAPRPPHASPPPQPRSPPLPSLPADSAPPLRPPPAPRTQSPPHSPRNEMDRMRLAKLKWAEEEAARRREQEIKDMELAMKLDREMNGEA